MSLLEDWKKASRKGRLLFIVSILLMLFYGITGIIFTSMFAYTVREDISEANWYYILIAIVCLVLMYLSGRIEGR